MINAFLVFAIAAGFLALWTKDLLISAILLSVFSLLCSLLYYFLHAPDVALTEAAVGAGAFNFFVRLDNPPHREEGKPVKTDILDFLGRKLSPYVLLFGIYLITHGYVSPGGGFQGGAVLASGLLLILLCRGGAEARALFPMQSLSLIEAASFYFFLLAGLMGALSGVYFLGPVLLPSSTWFDGAGFIFLLNIIIGLKVGAGMTLLCCITALGREGKSKSFAPPPDLVRRRNAPKERD